MTTLTSSTTFTVGASSTVVESAQVVILPAITAGTGRGRLVHPTLGTYDYAQMPNEWMNIDGDVIIAPTWASTKTLDGAANTLWQGQIRDVEVVERWTFAATLAHVRALLAMWQDPPDPDDGYVVWYPNYLNANAYNVVMLSISVGGEQVTFNHYARLHNMVIDDMALRMRVISRL